MLPSIIFRHRKENLKKCSLSGLEKREDLLFFRYPIKKPLPDLTSYVVLSLDGEPLSSKDNGVILVDATWKYAKTMQNSSFLKDLPRRCLPTQIQTVYPRKQTACSDPERGLASIEALFIAHKLLNKNTKGLLEYYYWKEAFLAKNRLAYAS